jgi:hypothetical protein
MGLFGCPCKAQVRRPLGITECNLSCQSDALNVALGILQEKRADENEDQFDR